MHPLAFELHIHHDNESTTTFKLELPDTPGNRLLDMRVALVRHLRRPLLCRNTTWATFATYTLDDWHDLGLTPHDREDVTILIVRETELVQAIDLERTYRVFFSGSIGVDAANEADARLRVMERLQDDGLDTVRFRCDLYRCEPTISNRYRQYIQLSTLVSVIDNHAHELDGDAKDVALTIARLHPGLERFTFESCERTISQYRTRAGQYVGTKFE